MTYLEYRYEPAIIDDALTNFLNCRQKDGEDLVDYTRRFKSARKVHETQWGNKFLCKKMAEADARWVATDIDAMKDCYNRADAKFVVYKFMMNSDQTKYGSIMKGLASQMALKNGQYPDTIAAAIAVLSEHPFDAAYLENRKKKKERDRYNDKEPPKKTKDKDDEQVALPLEMTFAQLEGACYCCGKKGHKSPQCKLKDKIAKPDWAINKTSEAAFNQKTQARTNPDGAVTTTTTPPIQQSMAATTTGTPADKVRFDWMSLHVNLSLQDRTLEGMKEWVLLDTGSTVSVFCNAKFVENIRQASETLEVHTNAGTFKSNQVADLPWHNEIVVWYDPKAITNVLSFASLAEHFKIQYNNEVDDVFRVHTQKGILEFKQVSEKLYLFVPSIKVREKMMLKTLDENKQFYTPRQIERAKAARALARAIGCP